MDFLVARGFATWRISHPIGETYECDREFESKRRTNVCNSADVEDSPHNGDRLIGVGGVGSGGLGLGGLSRGGGPGELGSGGWGRGVEVGGLEGVGVDKHSLYVNDLPNVSKFETSLFADDTTHEPHSIQFLQQEVSQEIIKVDKWSQQIKIILNY